MPETILGLADMEVKYMHGVTFMNITVQSIVDNKQVTTYPKQ